MLRRTLTSINQSHRVDCFPCIRLSSRIALPETSATSSGLGRIARFIRRYYAPFLMNSITKACVVIIFVGGFVASVISVQHIQLGLGEQSKATFMYIFN